MIEMIPLDRLVLSNFNPRKTRSQEHIDAIAESIRTLGLQQNLIGVARSHEADGSDYHVEIVGGGTRLLALQSMGVEDVAWATIKDGVPVRLYDDAEAALRAAIAENEARVDMHPVDQAVAYREQLDAGMTDQKVAAMFAKPVDEVRKIAALTLCIGPVQEACRAGTLSVDQARAFTIGTPEQQQALWDGWASRPSWQTDPRQIRADLKQAAVSDTDRRVKYVGLDAYETAGGKVSRDLFGGSVYVEDVGLLDKLVEEKLRRHASDICGERGFSWFGTALPEGYKIIGATSYAEVEVSEADAAAYDAFIEKYGEDFAPADIADEAERAEFYRIDDLMSASPEPEWSTDACSVSGVVVAFVDQWRREPSVLMGVVRPEDLPRATELGFFTKAGKPVDGAGTAAEEEKSAFSAKMVERLENVEAIALQRALMGKTELALAALAYEMASNEMTEHRFVESDAGYNVALREPVLGMVPVDSPDEHMLGRFVEDKKLRNATIVQGLAMGIARSRRRNFGPLIEQLGFRLRDWWTPGEDFFSAMKTDWLVALHDELTGADLKAWLKEGSQKGKAPVVAALVSLFADPKAHAKAIGITPDKGLAQRVKDWVPDPVVRDAPEADLAVAAE